MTSTTERWAALAQPSFRRLLVGSSLSSFGDSALYLSLGIWAKDLTGSNAAAGGVFLAQGLPSLLAPLSGHLVDRCPRKAVLLTANAATAVAVLALLLVHTRDQLWVMYAVAICYGASFTVIGPAKTGLVKDLLPDRDLAGANASFTTIGQGLRLISPLAGAALYADFGGGSLALLDAATFLVAISLIATVRVIESPIPPADRVPVRERLLVGIRYLREMPALARIVVAEVTAMLVLGFYESLTFAVVAALGRPASFFGVLMSVQALGSVAGGLTSAGLIHRIGEARTLGLALATWVVASLVYMIPSMPAACTALVVFGVAVPLNAVALATATQRFTPARLIGRVAASIAMLGNLAQMLSIAVGAVLIDRVDYRVLLVIVAAGAAAAALCVLRRSGERDYSRRTRSTPVSIGRMNSP